MLDYSSTTYGYLTIKQGNAQYKKDIQAIQEELDKQAYHHIIRVKRLTKRVFLDLKLFMYGLLDQRLRLMILKKECKFELY